MAADLLQQLRDIHLPEQPGWWPPAPGWWLLAVLAAGLMLWAAWQGRTFWRQQRPVRAARRLHEQAYQRLRSGEISERDYLDTSNELIKRVLIHGRHEHPARRASGDAWLALLDRHLDGDAFSSGPGKALGNERFRPDMQADTDAVHTLVNSLLIRLLRERPGPGR